MPQLAGLPPHDPWPLKGNFFDNFFFTLSNFFTLFFSNLQPEGCRLQLQPAGYSLQYLSMMKLQQWPTILRSVTFLLMHAATQAILSRVDPPTGLECSASPRSVTLSWSAQGSPHVHIGLRRENGTH